MTRRWRLIDGVELYDIQADPGQRHDVADDLSRRGGAAAPGPRGLVGRDRAGAGGLHAHLAGQRRRESDQTGRHGRDGRRGLAPDPHHPGPEEHRASGPSTSSSRAAIASPCAAGPTNSTCPSTPASRPMPRASTSTHRPAASATPSTRHSALLRHFRHRRDAGRETKATEKRYLSYRWIETGVTELEAWFVEEEASGAMQGAYYVYVERL